ncbi:DJ-1/PfpI family protein [Candidatus Micrarchaeota archaeon]|nr:DJ-1/PfpI family protein [Candidatus Micrarchaeota archaeon]
MSILFIIAPEKFRDEELLHTQQVLENYGKNTVVASTKKGTCTGVLGAKIESTLNLSEVNVDEYDAIVFVGGQGTPIIRNSDEATRITKEADQKGKIVAAICWAPTILAKAGILKERKATVWVGNDAEYGKTTDKVLEDYGAKYVAKAVVVDGNIVTADGPGSARQFGEEIAKLLNSK